MSSKDRKIRTYNHEGLIFGGAYIRWGLYREEICVSKSVRLILGEISAPSREPYQTVSAVLIFHLKYFENGPLVPGYVSVYSHHFSVPVGGYPEVY